MRNYFEIQPQQTIALVRRSGSAKTTLSKLILGLYPPTEGKVLFDNRDVSGIALKSLRKQIGVVDRDWRHGAIKYQFCSP